MRLTTTAKKAQVAAWDRLLAVYSTPLPVTLSDMLIKIFNDTDTLLFFGTLRNRVLVHWLDFQMYFLDAAPLESALSIASTIGPPQGERESVRPAIYLDIGKAWCYVRWVL